MIFLYPLASFWPAGRTKKRYRQAYTGRPAPFLWICRAGGYGAQNAFQGQHADKTGGFQRGPMPPLWHTTLLARCSVLYLPAWLTGETGRAMRFMSCLDRQKNGAEGLPPGMRKNDGRFCRVWAGICDDINTTNMLILLRAGTFPRCSSSGNSSPWLSDSQCTFFPFTIQATSS